MGAKGLRTWRKLIDATLTLVADTPLRDLRVADIAQAADTSAATFYVYFDTVIDVVLAAAAELTQSTPDILDLVSRFSDVPSGDARALAFIEAYVAFWDKHRPLLRTRNFAAEEGDVRFIKTREKAVVPLMQALAQQIETGKREGRVPASVIPYATAGTLLMMLERLGALGHSYDRDSNVTHADLVQAAAHIVSSALGWPTDDDAATRDRMPSE